MIVLEKKIIDELRDLQEKFDELTLKGLDVEWDDLLECRIIALTTELYEFINEVENFKFWKKNKNKTNQLEEASDMLHFILSISNQLSLEIESIFYEDIEIYEDKTFNELTLYLNSKIIQLKNIKDDDEIEAIVNSMFGEMAIGILVTMLGRIGYTASDLVSAYLKKNKINHKRQESNY